MKSNHQPFGWPGVRNQLRAFRAIFLNGGLVDGSNAPVFLRALGFKPSCEPFRGTILKLGGGYRI